MSRGQGKQHHDPVGETRLKLDGVDQQDLVGPGDANLRFLEHKFGGTLTLRKDQIIIKGPATDLEVAAKVCVDLIDQVRQGQLVDEVSLGYLWSQHSGVGETAA